MVAEGGRESAGGTKVGCCAQVIEQAAFKAGTVDERPGSFKMFGGPRALTVFVTSSLSAFSCGPEPKSQPFPSGSSQKPDRGKYSRILYLTGRKSRFRVAQPLPGIPRRGPLVPTLVRPVRSTLRETWGTQAKAGGACGRAADRPDVVLMCCLDVARDPGPVSARLTDPARHPESASLAAYWSSAEESASRRGRDWSATWHPAAAPVRSVRRSGSAAL